MFKTLGYDPEKDLAPISLFAVLPNVIVINSKLPPKTLAEFIAYAKAHPKELNYGSVGVGSSQHLAGAYFEQIAGIELTHVPYRNIAQYTPDFIAGQVPLGFQFLPNVLGLIKSGDARPLAVTSNKRMTALPDVPTAAEAGVKNYETFGWLALLAPAGTSRRYRQDLKALADAIKDPAVKDRFLEQGAEPVSPGPRSLKNSSRRKPSNGVISSIKRAFHRCNNRAAPKRGIHTLAGTHMAPQERVLIAGAGPVGLVAAVNLVRHGIPVTVLEAGPDLSDKSRASTFHPPTLDMLDDLGIARSLIAQGLLAPKFQYRSRQHGLIAQFDFAGIADVTRHPFRLQCEQSKLTRILLKNVAKIRISKSRSQARFARWIRTAVASP